MHDRIVLALRRLTVAVERLEAGGPRRAGGGRAGDPRERGGAVAPLALGLVERAADRLDRLLDRAAPAADSDGAS